MTHSVRLPRSPILAALIVAMPNAVVIHSRFHGEPLRSRLLLQLADLGQMLAVALAISCVAYLWLRFAQPLDRYRMLAVSLLALLVGALELPESFAGFAARSGDAVPETVTLVGCVVLCSLSLPAAAVFGWWLNRPRARWLGVGLAVLVMVANGRLLDADYWGIHTFVSLNALLLTSASLADVQLRTPLRRLASTPWFRHGTLGLAFGLAIASSVLPSESIRAKLVNLEAAPASRTIAIFRAWLLGGRQSSPGTKLLAEHPEWFRRRDSAPAVAASLPRLVPETPVVIFITIDCFRADVLEDERYRDQLPYFHELQDTSVYFSVARSTGAATVPSLATIFAGKHFSQLVWTKPSSRAVWPVLDESPRFPELLSDAGVETVTIASKNWLTDRLNVLAGFAEVTNLDTDTKRPRADHVKSRELLPVVEGRLAKVRQKPVFLYFHLMDPHSPYDSGQLKRGTRKDRYVSEIAGVGERLRELDDWLEDRGLAERVVLIVTADHGEAFGEHGTHQHSKTLYDELLRVPLFIRVPGVSSRRVDEPVSLIDIGPTILDLMGVATPGQYMGQSLVPFLRGESPTLTRPIVAEARLIQTIVFPDGMKPIRDLRKGTQELYDLKSDPAEEHNLIDGATGPHLELLERFFDEQTHPSYEKHAPYRP